MPSINPRKHARLGGDREHRITPDRYRAFTIGTFGTKFRGFIPGMTIGYPVAVSKTNRYSPDYDLDTDPYDLADTWDLACEISDHELPLVGDPDYDTTGDYLADRERALDTAIDSAEDTW